MTKILRRFLIQRFQERRNCTYPVIGIDDLRLKNRSDTITNSSIAVRDYYEWQKLSTIMASETFFTHRGKCGARNLGGPKNDLLLYDPIVTHSIAKWLLVNYKLNSYPYHDLNIVNIYADLRQSLDISKSMMTYFKAVLSETMFERIRIIMVPLYDHKPAQFEKLQQDIPGEVNLITDNAVFSSQAHEGINENYPFVIEDPVSVIMLNDVLRNLSHDLVRFSKETNRWEQGYLEYDNSGNKSLQFRNEIDFWCQFTIDKTLDGESASRRQASKGVYLPTRLAQLFELMKRFAPQHRFLAIDEPQRWNPSFSSMIKLLLGYSSARGSKIIQPRANFAGAKDPFFMTDFVQIQQMYMNINGMGRTCEINDLGEFVDTWVSLGLDSDASLTRDQLEAQLEMISQSTLATIQSN